MDLKQHCNRLCKLTCVRHVDVNAFDESLEYVLQTACVEEINSLTVVYGRNPPRRVPLLHRCLMRRQHEGKMTESTRFMAESLIRAGVEVNSCDGDSEFPMELAIYFNACISVIDALLDHGANLYDTLHKKTFLGLALEHDRYDICKSLLRAGFDIDTKYRVFVEHDEGQIVGTNGLLHSIAHGFTNDARFLIAENADPNCTAILIEPPKCDELSAESILITPLYLSAMSRNQDVTRDLLEARANPNFMNDRGERLLETVVNRASTDSTYEPIFRFLMQYGADPFAPGHPAHGKMPTFYMWEQRIYREGSWNPVATQLATIIRNKKREAVAMALHPRLGNGSNWTLPEDLTKQIITQVDF